MAENKPELERNLQSELHLAGRSLGEYARAEPNAIADPVRAVGSVHLSGSSVKNPSQQVPRTIEIRGVENIEG